jgi:hypothetical protein
MYVYKNAVIQSHLYYIKTSFLIFFFLFFTNYYSQGTNCLNAIELNVPSITNNTTCGNGNNYIGTNGCATTTTTIMPYGGQDKWFKISASEQGFITFSFSNIIGGCGGLVVSPNISIFSDCPNTPNSCILLRNGSTTTTTNGLFQVYPNQTYYIVIDAFQLSFINYCNCFSFRLSLDFIDIPINSDCFNIGADLGNLNGWYATTGNVSTGFIGGFPNYVLTNIGVVSGRHTIMNVGNDPYGGFPRVYPNGSGFSIRLGNDGSGSQGEQLIYRYTISQTTANLQYHYAVVLQDAGHQQQEQPFFRVILRDQNGNEIPCSKFFVVANANLDGFLWSNSPPGNIQYKPWSTVNVNLTNYIGQTITIEFTTGDCTQSAHFGYAYIDLDCSEPQIPNQAIEICEGDNISLTAPNGYLAYNWIPLGLNTQTINITPNLTDVITLNVTNFNGCVNNYQYYFTNAECCDLVNPVLHSE